MSKDMADKTIHAIVKGRVQGVYFRDCTRQEAQRLELCGWVRNLPDGTVEALITGESGKVDRMAAWLHRGSPMSLVREVTIAERTGNETFSEFTILY
jgi:acylphosphatase